MLSKQNQSRLEETKVEKRNEDEEYLRRHPEIAAAFRVITRVWHPLWKDYKEMTKHLCQKF